MKIPSFNGLLGLLLVSLLVACNGTSSSSGQDSANGDSSVAGGLHLKLEKKWATDTTLRAPESAIWDAGKQLFYVSNINGEGSAKDGNGFISQVGPDGNIIKLHWVDGLDAPKGLGIHNGMLYAADVDQLVLIDIASAKVKKKVPVPGSTFLNDIATDKQGIVYISDTRQGKVYRYADGKVSLLITKPEVKDANGLMVWNSKLWILTGSGMYSYVPDSQKLTLFTDAVKGGDGLALYNDSTFIASRWIGEIYAVDANGTAEKLLDTKGDKNTADLSYVPELKLLVVPTFGGNTIDAYNVVSAIKK